MIQFDGAGERIAFEKSSRLAGLAMSVIRARVRKSLNGIFVTTIPDSYKYSSTNPLKIKRPSTVIFQTRRTRSRIDRGRSSRPIIRAVPGGRRGSSKISASSMRALMS